MNIFKSGETLIASESDYSSGSIGFFGGSINDAYDLYLAENPTKEYVLIIFMKIQFIFKDNGLLAWTTYEKQVFTEIFRRSINRKWGNNRVVKTLQTGKRVFLDFRFELLIDGWSVTEHWEVHVKKIKKGAFSRSSVNPVYGTANLDSEDIYAVSKGNGMKQRGVVHEFGHMLGLPDEYKVGSTYSKAFNSIMNTGENIYSRHDVVYLRWLDNVLKEKQIK